MQPQHNLLRIVKLSLIIKIVFLIHQIMVIFGIIQLLQMVHIRLVNYIVMMENNGN